MLYQKPVPPTIQRVTLQVLSIPPSLPNSNSRHSLGYQLSLQPLSITDYINPRQNIHCPNDTIHNTLSYISLASCRAHLRHTGRRLLWQEPQCIKNKVWEQILWHICNTAVLSILTGAPPQDTHALWDFLAFHLWMQRQSTPHKKQEGWGLKL